MQDALSDLEGAGILNREQAALLRRIYGRELFSVHWGHVAEVGPGQLTVIQNKSLKIPAKYRFTALFSASK